MGSSSTGTGYEQRQLLSRKYETEEHYHPNFNSKNADLNLSEGAKGYLFAVELDSGTQTQFIWKPGTALESYENVPEIDEEYETFRHTLLLRRAIVGPTAIENEDNSVTVEVISSDENDEVGIRIPIASVTKGKEAQSVIDLILPELSDLGVIFNLTEGSGPVHIIGYHFVERAPIARHLHVEEEENEADGDEGETTMIGEVDTTMIGEQEEEEEEEEEDHSDPYWDKDEEDTDEEVEAEENVTVEKVNRFSKKDEWMSFCSFINDDGEKLRSAPKFGGLVDFIDVELESGSMTEYTWTPATSLGEEFKDLPEFVKTQVFRHTLTLERAFLSASAQDDEENVVCVEVSSPGAKGKVTFPLVFLKKGIEDESEIDLTFPELSDFSLTFTLTKGSGPVHIVGSYDLESGQCEYDGEEDEDCGEYERDVRKCQYENDIGGNEDHFDILHENEHDKYSEDEEMPHEENVEENIEDRYDEDNYEDRKNEDHEVKVEIEVHNSKICESEFVKYNGKDHNVSDEAQSNMEIHKKIIESELRKSV